MGMLTPLKRYYTQTTTYLLCHDQLGSFAAYFDGEVGAAVPRIDLAHACEIQAGYGRLDCGDILRMVEQRYGLRVF